jgi:hypothetical protein
MNNKRLINLFIASSPQLYFYNLKQAPLTWMPFCGLLMLLTSFVSHGDVAKDVTHVQILASAAPESYLAAAKVRLIGSNGAVLARGVTNIRGSVMFTLPKSVKLFLPFKVVTSGGLIMKSKTSISDAKAFKGHLAGRISSISDVSHTFGYVDLLTTVASKLASSGKNYNKSLTLVRRALGIGDGAPEAVIRYRNNHVGYSELNNQVKSHGGYKAFVRFLTNRVVKKMQIKGLSPSRSFSKESKPGAKLMATSSTSSFPQCNAPLGNGTSGTSSTEQIVNYGAVGMEALFLSVGNVDAAVGVDMATGMLLTGGPSGSAATADALNAVDEQLVCISAQLNYLSEQIDYLQFTTDVDTSSTCSGNITQQYYVYQSLVEQAMGNPSTSTDGLNSSNTSFVADVAGWGPQGSGNLSNCGENIYQTLFGTGGGQGSSWIQLNKNYQAETAWYTQYQAQALQQFLSFWSTLLYQNFVLINEYNNYNGNFENSIIDAGNYGAGGSNPSSTVCAAGATNATPSYCVWQSAIISSFPPSLFSDEIGMYNNGIAVNAFPANDSGIAGSESSNITVSWLIPQFKVGDPYDVTVSYDASNVTGPTYTQFNALGINPQGLDSAVETYLNPQAARTTQLTADQVSSLSNAGPGGVSAHSFFLSAISNVSGSLWPSGYTSQASFYTSDNVTTLNYTGTATGADVKVAFNSSINSETSTYNNCKEKNGYVSCNNYDPNYVVGLLLGRTWWSGASSSSSSSYSPPPPPTP